MMVRYIKGWVGEHKSGSVEGACPLGLKPGYRITWKGLIFK